MVDSFAGVINHQKAMKTILNPLIILITTTMLNSCIASRQSISHVTYTDDTTMEIIRYASLAGSSHNTQPWLVDVVSDTLIHIRADYTRKLQVVDPTARGLYISLGAFIENMCQAALSFGFDPQVHLTIGESRDNLVAEVILTPIFSSGNESVAEERSVTPGIEKDMLRKLEERSTLRIPFNEDEISIAHIEKITGGITNGYHFIPAASAEGKYISSVTSEAYRQQSNDEAAKNELAGWIRFSNSDVRKRRDGLTTSGMGINGFAGFIVSRVYKPEDSKKQSFVDTGVEKARLQTEKCGGWLVITQTDDTPVNWIATGRLYQRTHLECRDLMIGLHPMNQMIEVENFEEDANMFLNLGGRIQFVARIGYVDSYPSPVSVRRDVSEFTTDLR